MNKGLLSLTGGLIIAGSVLIWGCRGKDGANDIALRVNNFVMTGEELEEEFEETGMPGCLLDKRKFLDDLINRKLILQEAQRRGLDKQKEFLKAIERFWEQSLLKIMINRKSKEIADQISVTDREIESRYEDMLKQGLVSKPLSESYNEIKWQVLRNKQTQALNAWVGQLRQKAKIEIKGEISGEEKQE